MIFKGRVWKFGDNIDTDAIIPARYLTTSDPKELAAHCMEDADPDFVAKMNPGDIIRGGQELRVRHLTRTRTHINKGSRRFLRHRQDFRPYFLPQRL